ncbi:MAG: ABC transporter ATP-binding protein [Acidimicrobiales bacterium]
MSSITFSDVTKRFDDTLAVDDLDLEIADGEFLVLLGPSGCGKSTALRMLAGLETPTSGTISIGNEVVNDVEPRQRDVAMVFQSYALYPHMSVAKNIESPLIGRRRDEVDRNTRHEMVVRAATMLGLEDLLDRKPGQLSGGQRQRVALARAIVRRPAVFCMDEPLSNLDAKLRTQTRAELVKLHQELATTFVYVTHDQVEAMTMASRIAVIDQGRLQQVDEPRLLYGRPANLFVARFIGSPPMNILPGAVADDLGHVNLAGGTLAIGDTWTGLEAGRPVEVGVRPEHLRESETGITVTVETGEWLGHEQIITLDASGTDMRLRDSTDAIDSAPGATLTVSAAIDDVHLFDPDTGRRIDGGPA